MLVKEPASKCKPEEKPMNNMHYVGLDIHKKTISYCVRQSDGTILQENTIAATRPALETWMRQLPQPWTAGMEPIMPMGAMPVCSHIAHTLWSRGSGRGLERYDFV